MCNYYSLTDTCQLLCLVPSEPQLEMVSVNSSSVNLQWTTPDPPNGVITQYSIQLNGTDIDDLNSSVRMYTIGGLSPDTVYVLQLSAHTIVGKGPPNNKTIITCKLLNTIVHKGSCKAQYCAKI